MPEDTYITDAMRSIIGRTYREAQSYPISRSDIRKWAIAIYYPAVPPRLYFDEDYAKTTSYGGIVAPEDFNPFAWATAKPALDSVEAGNAQDAFEAHLGIEGSGLVNSLNAGGKSEYGVRMRPDDVIRSSIHVASYAERPGRMGTMLITTLRETWINQNDDMVQVILHSNIRY